MSVTDDLREHLAHERAEGVARMRARGCSEAEIQAITAVALAMHEEQVQCAARMVGEAPPVAVH